MFVGDDSLGDFFRAIRSIARHPTSIVDRRRSVPPRSFPTSSGIVLTNDGNAILREIDVTHPAAKVRVPGARIARRAQTTDRPFLNVVARSTTFKTERNRSIDRSIGRSFVRSIDRLLSSSEIDR